MSGQESSSGGGPQVNMEVASLVGSVTIDTKDSNGKPVTLLLDNFGFDDWSVVQERFLKKRRSGLIESAVEAGKSIVDAADESTKAEALKMAKMLREEAMTMASRLSGITDQDFVEMMGSNAGSALFLWVMVERRYPGRFTVADVERMIQDDAVTASTLLTILDSLKVAMGMAGNSRGQGK